MSTIGFLLCRHTNPGKLSGLGSQGILDIGSATKAVFIIFLKIRTKIQVSRHKTRIFSMIVCSLSLINVRFVRLIYIFLKATHETGIESKFYVIILNPILVSQNIIIQSI